ncbi:hypothetical protein J0S82_001662, partial [Galemys pyrenaicus]
RRIVRDALSTRGLAGDHSNYGSITGFQEFGALPQLFPRRSVFSFLSANLQHLPGMVRNSHLSCGDSRLHWWVTCAVPSPTATMNTFGTFLTLKPTLPTEEPRPKPCGAFQRTLLHV